MRLRSLLFVPGDRHERFGKALASGADAVIFDLEDSVSAARKDDARHAVADVLAQGLGPVHRFVRINPLGGGMTDRDLGAAKGADGIVLPKAVGGASVAALIALLGDTQAWILPIATETPASVFELGTFGGLPRLCGLTWGAEDLSAAVGATESREPDRSFCAPYQVVRTLALFGAHSAGVPAIETIFPDVRDLDGIARYAARGVRDGFSGMLAIHPAQVPVINAAFMPSDVAVARALAIVTAFASDPDAGVLEIDGCMVDAPHLKQARRILASAGVSDAAR